MAPTSVAWDAINTCSCLWGPTLHLPWKRFQMWWTWWHGQVTVSHPSEHNYLRPLHFPQGASPHTIIGTTESTNTFNVFVMTKWMLVFIKLVYQLFHQFGFQKKNSPCRLKLLYSSKSISYSSFKPFFSFSKWQCSFSDTSSLDENNKLKKFTWSTWNNLCYFTIFSATWLVSSLLCNKLTCIDNFVL